MTTQTVDSAPLDVRFEWNRAEFLRSWDATHRHSRILPPWVGWAFLALLYASTIRRYIQTPADAVRVAAITGAILFVCWLIPNLAARQLARMKEREIGPDGRSIVTTFSDRGVRRSNGKGDAFFAWASLRRVVETEEFVLIFYHWGNAFFIPRRTIAPHTLAELRGIIRRHLPGKATLLHE
ncbi:MAG TPA: YcxB family protein [Longimicrobium sp.]|uniref:YcxB family protein n=1 Tax=Longimicrobium sp. TaxID=2029185 RepID=UPI002EDB9A68